jgi:DNA-binding GntR family transcriptional regulator
MDVSAAPISRRTVAAEVALRLRARILSGALADGAPLRQDAIAAELGVSRIPVREALAQLEAEGLVRVEPHRGAFVAGLAADDMAELFEMRAAIEPLLLRRAVPRLRASDLATARSALADFEAALADGDADRWGELNWRFHAALYAPAGRPRMLRLAQELNNSAARCVRLHLGLAGTLPRAHADHERLLELCEAGNVDDAAALLARHILEAGQALTAFLARPAALEPARCA